jgi:hypothetical protein
MHMASWLTNFGKEQFDSQLTHPATWLAHRGDRDAALGREVVVVITHHHKVIWNRDPEIRPG